MRHSLVSAVLQRAEIGPPPFRPSPSTGPVAISAAITTSSPENSSPLSAYSAGNAWSVLRGACAGQYPLVVCAFAMGGYRFSGTYSETLDADVRGRHWACSAARAQEGSFTASG